VYYTTHHGKLKDKSQLRPSLGYITNSDGIGINGFEAKLIQQTCHELCTSIQEQIHAPETWTQAPHNAINYFHTNMYQHHPNIHLCEGHWKVNLLAIEEYPSWCCQSNKDLWHSTIKCEASDSASNNDSHSIPINPRNNKTCVRIRNCTRSAKLMVCFFS